MQTKQLIEKYYDSFNKQDMDTFFGLLSNDIRHDINHGKSEVGKDKFTQFMQRMNHCYTEMAKDLIVMVSEDGKRAAAEFIIDGTYKVTDPGLPEARGQHYSIPCGAFFEIEDGKISRVTNYYNLTDWLKQVS